MITSAYANTLGVPGLFSHILFPELLKLTAKAGAKNLIQQYIGSGLLGSLFRGRDRYKHSRGLSAVAFSTEPGSSKQVKRSCKNEQNPEWLQYGCSTFPPTNYPLILVKLNFKA